MNARIALFLVGLVSGIAQAGEADVKKTWESTLKFPATSVTKSGYLGLYEVFANGEIYYTDEKVSAVLQGELIDAKSRQNITQARLQKLNAIKFADLPLDQAVKLVRGNGNRVFATFEDPNCGYCKRLARDVAALNNATVYVFMYPILGQDSVSKAERIWCAPDRARTWSDWMAQGVEPPAGSRCDVSALTRNLELGRKLRVNGTPTMFFTNGERAPGAIPLAEIEKRLN